MAHSSALRDKLVVLIGGTGFVGSHVAAELLQRGARVRIASRNPEEAYTLKPLANLGQLQFARCNAADRRSVETVMQGADAAAYLVGTFGGNQKALHADGAGYAAEAAANAGASAFAYVSAIGADADDEQSQYSRTKGMGERQVLAAFPKASILRPSVIFGEQDEFVNMFAGLIRSFPALPVFGADSKFQPVWVDDVANALVNALENPGTFGGKTFELGGPETLTMEELHRDIARAQGRDRTLFAVPDALGRMFASVPFTPISSDQYVMLERGSTLSDGAQGIEKLGVQPRPLSLFLDKWMTRYRKHGRFTERRAV